LADAAFRANLRNISADTGAVRAHDELLARACVFGYLYDRHFLHSPELLLNELRWLKASQRPDPPGNCLHPPRFRAHRDALLDTLVLRFQNLLDYRDSLVEPEPAAGPEPAAAARRTGEQPRAGETVRQSYYQLAQLYRRTKQPEQSRAALDSFMKLKQQADARQAQKLQDKLKRAPEAQAAP